ncbi:MAG TPA: NADPH-dependent F420 reductase [Nitrososphaeraceae archaeon]|nr:NADPH-dependent F420 reductase [Nitrososphaeraceae archaeon]
MDLHRMRIGIVGGTGGMGEGFALRWCLKHDIFIGSRDATRAGEAAKNYMISAREIYGSNMTGNISGEENVRLSEICDLVILSIPYESTESTCTGISERISPNCVIVTPIIPMRKEDKGFTYLPLEEGVKSAAELVSEYIRPRGRIVSAFHTISEVKLKDVKQNLTGDTFVCGDDQNNVSTINSLISEINGLRPIYLGPLSLSYQAEILTPMLLNASKRNKIKHPGLIVT